MPHRPTALAAMARELVRYFEALVGEVRRSEAEPLLRTTSLPILDVSEQVGYSDARAFRRAFQR